MKIHPPLPFSITIKRFMILKVVMPLKVELYTGENWIEYAEFLPGSPLRFVANRKADGTREVYLFQCLPDDSKSVIYRSVSGLDTEAGSVRILSTADAEIVKELKKIDEPYEMEVQTDKIKLKNRFTHV